MRIRKTISAFIVGLVLLYSSNVFAAYSILPANECDLTNAVGVATNACTGLVGSNSAIGANAPGLGANYWGARSLSMLPADTAIHASGYCFYVNNSSSDSIFVPFKTYNEIYAFVTNLPPSINLSDCSTAGTVLVPPSFPGSTKTTQCVASTPASQPVYVPEYLKYNSSLSLATYTPTASVPFNCQSADGTVFTEAALPTFVQQDSGNPVTQPGWTIQSMAYTYDGVCGAANGIPAAAVPSSNLCHVGTAPSFPTSNGSSWVWTCPGGNGAGSTDAPCSAAVLVNGQCNSATEIVPSPTMPSANLCIAGSPTGVSSGGGVWSWQCVGIAGGATATCSEPDNAPINGQCNATTTGTPTATAPSVNLCNAGIPSPVANNGSTWNWSCTGINNGTSASCSASNPAPPVKGACDTGTEGIASNTFPTGNLCYAGTPSGGGGGGGNAWTWSCDGTGGGGTASCSAPWAGASCTGPVSGLGTVTEPDGWTYLYQTHARSGNNMCYTHHEVTCTNGSFVEKTTGKLCFTDSCFPPDTPVLTTDRGWQPIASIQQGDQVVSFDAKGHNTVATVLGLKITPDRKLRRINGIVISTLQKVQLATGKYKRVEALKLGDVLVDTDGHPHPITALEDMPGLHTVYNPLMKDHNTPFYAAGVRVKDWQ
jgi:hypothetical protein